MRMNWETNLLILEYLEENLRFNYNHSIVKHSIEAKKMKMDSRFRNVGDEEFYYSLKKLRELDLVVLVNDSVPAKNYKVIEITALGHQTANVSKNPTLFKKLIDLGSGITVDTLKTLLTQAALSFFQL